MKNIKLPKFKRYILLILIVILASYFRLVGSNWDNFAHLHPDERYMTMVATAIKWPEDFETYLNPVTSSLSPFNNNYGSYIYGTLPLFIVKFIAESIDLGDYANLNLVGRTTSAIIDIGNLLLVFFIGNNIYKRRLGLLAAGLYALAVIPIQQSHFFTTDTYETFFILTTFSLLIVFLRTRSVLLNTSISIFIGMSIGFGLASKLSAVVFGAIIAMALAMKFLKQLNQFNLIRNIFYIFDFALLIGVVTYIVFRLTQPYMFINSNWLDITPHPEFINAFNFQRLAIKGEVMFPPQWQWVDKTSYLFPASNILIWGLGIPIGISSVIGLFYFIYEQLVFLKSHHKIKQLITPLTSPLLLAFVWIILDFVYRGGNFVISFRYLLAIIPFLVIFASYGLQQARTISHRFYYFAVALVFVGSLLWAVAFTSIYRTTTTRIAASDWIYENVPPDKTIANEHWDDAIPFSTQSAPPFEFQNRTDLEVYNPDDATKIPVLYGKLSTIDYIFVTSDRARMTIGRLPKDYPIMTRYYRLLDTGELGFTLAQKVSSYPKIGSLEIDDSSAEEAFWVYDHPTVRIYRKDRQVSMEEFSCYLSADNVQWVSNSCLPKNPNN
jgi:hypothetical protein